MAKLPALMWYVGDWMKDPGVRSIGIAGRGLWFDMLCLMHESSRRGYLQHANGKPVTADQLARMTGCSTDEVSRLLQELEASDVYSRTEAGVIFCRRMVRDETKRTKCSLAGKRGGGNPTFKGHSKGAPKGSSKRHPKGALEDENEAETEFETPPLKEIDAFVALWDATPGVARVGMATNLPGSEDLLQRMLDPAWLLNYPKALEKFPLPFWTSKGNKPTATWFLKPDTVGRILCGDYDNVWDGKQVQQHKPIEIDWSKADEPE